MRDRKFVPGHPQRALPAGDLESVRSGENPVEDEGLAVFYEQVRSLTVDPLWSLARLRDVYELNFTSRRVYRAPYLASEPLPGSRASAARRKEGREEK